MVHLYSTFIQGALHRLRITFTHSHVHSYTDGGGIHARLQPDHREQLGVQSLDQGLFDTNSGGARDRTGNLPCSNDGNSTPEPCTIFREN